MKKFIVLLSVMSILLLAGCGVNEKDKNNELSGDISNQHQESVENIAFSNEQLIEMVKTYREAKGEYIPEFIVVEEDKDNIVTIHLYDVVDDHTATSEYYYIDRNSGIGKDLLGEKIDLNKITEQDDNEDDERLITLEGFDINKLRELIETENLVFDKEYVIGYTELGKNPVNYKVMYKKTSSYLGLEEYIILENDLTKLELCFYAERSDYIEKIFMINEENILVLATYNEHGDSSQNIYMYDYKLNPLKNSEGRENDLHYDDWVVALGYEHQYSFDIINDKIIIYRNDYNTNEKVTYQVDIEEDPEIEKYYYSVNEKTRTTEGFNVGAGRT